MSEPTPANYKDTLNLPKTSFDMKANLTQREPKMVAQWAQENLYAKIRQRPHPKGKWILHDGPPYANGDIHMGHLVNKVLKDIVVKFRTMQGHDSPYVPGWDCHGLPIETAIQKELDKGGGAKFRELTKDEVRKRCADYAMKYVKLQGDSFQRLGIFGSFDNPYLTMDKRYEAGILEVLAELVQRDLVYRQKKPVHWCTNDRTALAEAELEYQTKKDTSIFVKFRAKEDPRHRFNRLDHDRFAELDVPPVFYLIWTTTPWTLPANRAVAINPHATYALISYVQFGKREHAIVAQDLVNRVFANKELSATQIGSVLGSDLVGTFGANYVHPLDSQRICPVIPASFVTLEDGTGLVHIAPAHGKEDYTARDQILRTQQCNPVLTQDKDVVVGPVLSDGRYDDTVPEFIRGKSIWDANPLIIEKLKELGTLFHHAEFSHEYPHCWRCKKPTIQRATEQWFIKASGDSTPAGDNSTSAPEGPGTVATGGAAAQQSAAAAQPVDSRTPVSARPEGAEEPRTNHDASLWSTAKQFINQTQWIPTWGKNRIEGMLDTRPDWCISRQRSWGVPIPAFFDDQGNCLLTEKSVRQIAAHFKEHGADSWYTHTPAQLLGVDQWEDQWFTTDGKLETRNSKLETCSKGMDILDVWFESGASHHAVLECTHPELGYPANMYLEGSDQHRGWFQSSLLEASGYKSQPPFKEVLTHGFVVDDQGKKYSKSSGNYVPVEKLLTQHGADVLRLWVSSVDYQNDIKFGPALISSTSEAYRKIRNTMRYLLGNLYDFSPQTDSVAPNPHSIDAWMQAKVAAWEISVTQCYDRYEFHNVFKQIYEFCNVEISAVYAKAIKDRLYCELPNSNSRRASQTVCYHALMHLIELCAPILVFTSQEAWSELHKLPGCAQLESSIHLRMFHHWDPRIEEVEDFFGKVKGLQHDPSAFENFKKDGSPLNEALRNFASMAKSMRADHEVLASSLIHWSVLLPLIEKGNKKLDDLKRSIALGNPLDAEAVIIVPTVEDEVSKLITAYGPEIEDALGVGFHRIEQGASDTWDIRIEDTREKYPSCARSWKRRPDVGSDKDFPDLSARDAQVVRALRGK